MSKVTINLNNNSISLRDFKYGKTQNIVIQVGSKLYYMDVTKNKLGAFIETYQYDKNREKIRKQ